MSNFFKTNQHRLKAAKERSVAAIEAFSTSTKKVQPFPSHSGFFFMADFSDFLDEKTWEAEQRLQDKFIAAKILIVAGNTLAMPSLEDLELSFLLGIKTKLKKVH